MRMSEKWPWPEMALKRMTQVYSIALLISVLEEDSSDSHYQEEKRQAQAMMPRLSEL